MCGRFVSREQAAIEREYNIRVRQPFERVYNAAPSMELPVIRQQAGSNAPGAAVDEVTGGAREVVAMR